MLIESKEVLKRISKKWSDEVGTAYDSRITAETINTDIEMKRAHKLHIGIFTTCCEDIKRLVKEIERSTIKGNKRSEPE